MRRTIDPFSDPPFAIRLGVQALDRDKVLIIDDEHIEAELRLKQQLLTKTPVSYFSGGVATLAMQWEVVVALLPSLADRYPHYFTLDIFREKDWFWQNHLLGRATRFRVGDETSLPREPVDWLGQQVQEDLLLLSGDVTKGFPLIGGQLCFPNAWCLSEKLGQPLAIIHAPVPTLATTAGSAIDLLLQRLKSNRPVIRSNWALKPLSRLNLIPDYYHEVAPAQAAVTANNAGDTCYLRIERQVLLRLPQTNGILFTVHTYVSPLSENVRIAGFADRFASILRSLTPEMLAYKGIAPFVEPVLAYLDANKLTR